MQNKIKEMTENGFSAKRIAINLEEDHRQIIKTIKQNNYSIKKEQFNDSKIEKILELYELGVSAKNLGKKYSIDKRRIQKWAKEKEILRNRNEIKYTNDVDKAIPLSPK